MRLLILGGTRFLGRHLVEAALKNGHDITLFHRGQSGKDLFEGQVERILGDRTKDLSGLSGRNWDAVVDTCGYLPRVVRLSAEKSANEGLAGRYLFISSISVYKDPPVGADENWAVGNLDDPAIEEITGETYGPLKALCEEEVRAAFAKRCLVARPGLIVGPNDPTDRFTHWLWRLSKGGDVLVPGRKDQPVQFIDVRDLASWCLSALEQERAGTFNLTGPEAPYRLGALLETMRDALSPHANLHWVDPAKLEEWGVAPWTELPLYVGAAEKGDGMMAVSIRKVLDAGLSLTPLEHTIRDTLAWAQARPKEHEWKSGLEPAREKELLDLWWS